MVELVSLTRLSSCDVSVSLIELCFTVDQRNLECRRPTGETQWDLKCIFLKNNWGLEVESGLVWYCKTHLVRRSSGGSITASDTASEGARKRSPIRNLIVLHSRREGRVASKVRIEPHLQRWKEKRGINVSHPCHDIFPNAPLTQGATEDRSRQQCLSVQQRWAVGGEQRLGKLSGDAPKGGELGHGM